MTSRNPRDWLQILGQFGVVASLMFVGWQIQQDREIARSAAYQARSELIAEFYWTVATDAVGRSAMEKIRTGSADLTDPEVLAARWLWRSAKEIMQNSYYQYRQGYLDQEHWDQIRELVQLYLNYPLPRSVLRDGNSRRSFEELLDQLDAENAAEALE